MSIDCPFYRKLHDISDERYKQLKKEQEEFEKEMNEILSRFNEMQNQTMILSPEGYETLLKMLKDED